MKHPTVIMFKNGIPTKAHCGCRGGISGICCHILTLLLSLKRYHDIGEKIQVFTEQLQK